MKNFLTPKYVLMIISALIFSVMFIFSPVAKYEEILVKIFVFLIGIFLVLLFSAKLFDILFVQHPDKQNNHH